MAADPRIIAETERWLVVNKPAGWLTIAPSAPLKESPPVLADWARGRARGQLWVVHRLDRETSGVLLFAKTEEAHREASLAFQERENRKLYDCLAQGAPVAPVFKVNEPIEGAPSTSQVEVREKFAGCFLARVRPASGRRHQIRIHLAKAGYPICGDPKYGGARKVGAVEFPRVALHAASLELPTGERFEAPWPEDFAGWISELRGPRA